MRLSRSIQMCLCEREVEGSFADGPRGGHGKEKFEFEEAGTMQPQAEECQQSPEAKKGKEQILSPTCPGGAQKLTPDFSPPEL